MATGSQSEDFYTQVLECVGFYRDGRPLAGAVWSSNQLALVANSSSTRSFEQIDRRFVPKHSCSQKAGVVGSASPMFSSFRNRPASTSSDGTRDRPLAS